MEEGEIYRHGKGRREKGCCWNNKGTDQEETYDINQRKDAVMESYGFMYSV
jgi:hypothetical protein